MHFRNTTEHYGLITKLLHALIALCFIAQIVLGYVMGDIVEKATSYQLYGIHKSIGFSLLLIGLVFVFWRGINDIPKKPAHLHTWERQLSKWVQLLLYCGIIIMPLSGWLMSSYGGHPVNFWGWVNVAAPVRVHKHLASFCADVHVVTSFCVAGLIGLHLLGVLKHLLVDKHNILRRMF